MATAPLMSCLRVHQQRSAPARFLSAAVHFRGLSSKHRRNPETSMTFSSFSAHPFAGRLMLRAGIERLLFAAAALVLNQQHCLSNYHLYIHIFSMDVSRLRRALRLVHCLQKERGASCAVLACESDGENGFSVAMKKARDATDVASQRLYRKMPPALAKIRLQLDQRTSTQVHRMLVIYNTLISNVEHEYVQTCINASRQSHSSKPLLKSQRSKSTNDFAQYAATTVALLKPPMPVGARSVTDHITDSIKSCSDPALFAFPPTKSPPSILLQNNNNHGRYYTPQVTTHKQSSPRNNRRTKQTSFNLLEQDRTLSLLNLLGCLVRLKESTGMQRAVISSMLGQEDQMLLTSLILEVENQRKLLHELQQLPEFDYSLQTLVQDSVTMGHELELLQTKILQNFEFPSPQEIQSLNVWNMITVYIDKLYALELLLVEELEYCQDETEQELRVSTPTKQSLQGGENNSQAMLMEQVFGTDSQVQVSEMPAEMVKQKVVDYMGTPPPPPPPTLGESASAPLLHSPEQQQDESPAKTSSLLSGMLSQQQQRPPTEEQPSKEWQISLDELQFKKRIGSGTAGTTYLAKWSGQLVAVKVAALSDMGLDGWKAEIQALQRLHHPNVIRLLGSVYNENPLTYCLVLEYCNAGDLSHALQGPTPPNFFVSVATDIANGMAYLHKRGVLHRDIKPSNVLLDGNIQNKTFTAKVSDFGVATTYAEETDANRTAETGTYRWMSPEIIRHESYSLKADVYSFAILCWQLLTREVPFANVSPLEAAGKVALELARPPFPEGTPACIQDLIATCWAEEPSSRLSFQEISQKLGELDLSVEERTWLQAPMGHAVYDKQQVVKAATYLVQSQQLLQVPSAKPPLTSGKDPRRASGFRRIFPKQSKK